MRTTTIIKRLEMVANEKRGLKNTRAYKMINEAIATGEIIRPCYTSGSGRFTSNLDYTGDVERLLQILGLRYKCGNDAPRGGLPGNWIKIITKITK